MTADEPYKVGKNRPPLHSRFKKGQPSANPKGARKAGPVDIPDFFEQPVTVEIRGQKKKLHPREAEMLSLLERAVKRKDMRAAARLIGCWAEAGLIANHEKWSRARTMFRLPGSWTLEAWMMKFAELGPPPWPGPRNGLHNPDWRAEALSGDE